MTRPQRNLQNQSALCPYDIAENRRTGYRLTQSQDCPAAQAITSCHWPGDPPLKHRNGIKGLKERCLLEQNNFFTADLRLLFMCRFVGQRGGSHQNSHVKSVRQFYLISVAKTDWTAAVFWTIYVFEFCFRTLLLMMMWGLMFLDVGLTY